MADKKSVCLPEGILLAAGRLKGGYPAVSEANPDYQSESRGDVVSVSGVGTCGAGSVDLLLIGLNAIRISVLLRGFLL
jgi:hypothetical protein